MSTQDLLEKMKENSSKKDPMIARTIRLQRDLDSDLHKFADDNNLDFSVVVRTMLLHGWNKFNGA